MSSRVPILVYHHVFPDDNPELAVTTDKRASGVIGVSEFRRQMDFVLDNGWQVVSTTEIVTGWRIRGNCRRRPSRCTSTTGGWTHIPSSLPYSMSWA